MEFRILGPLEVEEDGRVLKLGGAQQRALLALLLLHANEVVPRDRLIDELWDGRAPETAATAIQVHVSQLRKLLGRDVIVTQRPGYLIRAADGELDLERFEQAVERARSATPSEAAELLRSALALWRGVPFADVDAPFVRAARIRLEEQRLAAREQRIEADLELGRHTQLVPELEGLVDEHPLRERLRGQLMLALYRAGRQADALAVYQEGRRALVDELGLEPGDALQQLERAILNHEPALALATTAALPTGTVTLLFTDIEGSTQLLELIGTEAYAGALDQHRRLLRDAFARHDGCEVDTQGDAFFVAFPRAAAAVAAAAEAQRTLADGPVRVRIGIHTGEPIATAEGYVGVDVHKGARIAAAGHGGQVLLSASTRDLVDAEVRDLGEHRLKDLTAPERLYQLGDDEFPPLKTLDATNLPVAASPLLGRGRELDELLQLLRDGTRLVTVTGPGGTGKTRLALQVAAELVGSFEHGVFWVPLAALGDSELVVSQIAQTIGARGELAAHVRDKEMLLLVDNLEHLLAAAPALGEVLAQAKGLRLLVTSRAPLHLRGEYEYPLDPLAEEDAVTLFVERAREAGRDLEPDETIAAICRRLDSLPLALELAAARTKLLAPSALLERLDRALPLLTAGARDAPVRQQTLRATIEWSYDLLGDDARQLFARLAVFAGSFSLEAAEDVCAAGLDALTALVDLSLLKPIEDTRFLMLETIREFAVERLESGDAGESPKRHARWYLQLAKRATDSSEGALPHEWLVRLDADLENLRKAIRWAQGHDAGLEGELVAVTSYYLSLRGFFGETLSNVRHALENAQPGSLDQGELLIGATRVAIRTGDYADAKRWCEQCLELARAHDNARLIARSLIGLAILEDDAERARMLYLDAADVARAARETRSLATVAYNLGALALDDDAPEIARPYFLESLELNRKLSNEGGEAACLSALASVALAEGKLDEAEAFLVNALPLASHRGDKDEVHRSLMVATEVAAHRREAARAARLLGAADALREEMGLVPYDDERKLRALIEALVDGDDTVLAAAASEGRALTLDEAVAYAFEGLA